VDTCYQRYQAKLARSSSDCLLTVHDFDFLVFHAPYTKLVQKAFARMVYNDFRKNDGDERYSEVVQFKSMSLKDSYFSKELERAFMALSKPLYETKVLSSLLCAKELGNLYCGSVYAGLISLLSSVDANRLINRRLGVFSYGSGLASSMFSFRVQNKPAELDKIRCILNISERLSKRETVSPKDFEAALHHREQTHQLKDYRPIGDVSKLFPDTFYLTHVDSKHRRFYDRK